MNMTIDEFMQEAVTEFENQKPPQRQLIETEGAPFKEAMSKAWGEKKTPADAVTDYLKS
jgi:hypothetical protein